MIVGMADGTIKPKGSEERYKPNTIRSYERSLRLYIAPSALGKLRVTEVRRSDVQAMVDLLLATKSGKTVSNILNPLQIFYGRGVDREELALNPTEGIDLPTGKSKRPRRIVSAAEAARSLANLSLADRALWATAFYAGLRRGELQALRCKDLDFGANLIHVEKGWDQKEGEIEPKSPAAKRDVPLLAILRGYLEEHLLITGRRGDDCVFGRSSEQAFYPSTVDGRAKRAWEAANEAEQEAAELEGRDPELITPLTMHECRHTFASLLIDTGANAKAIQAVMGHSKIQTTFDIYGHLLPGSHDEVRQQWMPISRLQTTFDLYNVCIIMAWQ